MIQLNFFSQLISEKITLAGKSKTFNDRSFHPAGPTALTVYIVGRFKTGKNKTKLKLCTTRF
jgi:hypothetical protein